MKATIIIALACIAGYSVEAQKVKAADVPTAIREEFARKFPNVTDVDWSKEGNSGYEAEFEISNIERSANFDTHGKWLETETEIKADALPQAVRTSINKDFAGYKIDEAEKLETPEHPLLYEVELKKQKTTYEVQYSPNGVLVKKEVEKDEEKDKK